MKRELTTGVNLHIIPTKKYKTTRISIRFSTPLKKETVTKRALLSSLMETNSLNYSDQVKVSEALAELYGASFGITVTKKGNRHYFSISLSVVDDQYISLDQAILTKAVAFLQEIIFAPNRSELGFDAETFTREKQNLQEYIASIFDDKQTYASLELQKLYFSDSSDQSVPSFGTLEDLEKETPASISTYYDEMIKNDLVDILVIGDVEETELRALFEKFPLAARNDLDKKTLFYHQSVKQTCHTKIDVQPVVQSKLNIGYATSTYYYQEDYFPLVVFNGLFGGFPHSKLFMNVREKESMAYYASSSVDTFRGYMSVQTGIEGKNREKVLRLVEEQLVSLQQGNITAEELTQTKAMLKNHYLMSLDSAAAVVEKEYVKNQLPETAISDEEWQKRVEQVTIQAVKKVAGKIQMQAVYFMEGAGN